VYKIHGLKGAFIMLQKFELKGVHTNIDEQLRTYATKKIGRLDKYLPRHHRDSVHTVVELKEGKARDKKHYCCDVTMHLPHGDVNVQEKAYNMYEAIDIVETKLKQAIRKYKDQHANGKLARHLAGRLRRSPVAEAEA